MSRKLYLLTLILGLSSSLASCTKPEGPLDTARRLAIEKDLDGAFKILDSQRKAVGLSAELGLLLGGVYEGRGEPASAVAVYRQTAKEFPGSGAIELRLADIFLQLGQTKACLERLQKARAAGESDADVALSMAVAHGLLGQFKEADTELDRAEKAGVAPATVKYNRGLLLRQSGDNAGSRDLLFAAYEESPTDHSILRELARAELLLAVNQDLEAVARAEEYVNESISIVESLGRTDWRGYEILGDCFLVRRDYDAASEMYLKAKEVGKEPDVKLDDKYYDAQVLLRAQLSGEDS